MEFEMPKIKPAPWYERLAMRMFGRHEVLETGWHAWYWRNRIYVSSQRWGI